MNPAPILTAVTWLGAGLLLYAGALKLPVPDAAMTTLHKLRLPSGRTAARLLALAEMGVGVTVVLTGGLVAAALSSLTWSALTVVAAVQRARHIDCACFGVRRYPVSRLHVSLNAILAVASLLGLAAQPWSLAAVHTDAGILALVATAVLLGTGVALLMTLTQRAGLAAMAKVG